MDNICTAILKEIFVLLAFWTKFRLLPFRCVLLRILVDIRIDSCVIFKSAFSYIRNFVSFSYIRKWISYIRKWISYIKKSFLFSYIRKPFSYISIVFIQSVCTRYTFTWYIHVVLIQYFCTVVHFYMVNKRSIYTIFCTAVHFYMVHKRSIYTIFLYRGTLSHGKEWKWLYVQAR